MLKNDALMEAGGHSQDYATLASAARTRAPLRLGRAAPEWFNRRRGPKSHELRHRNSAPPKKLGESGDECV